MKYLQKPQNALRQIASVGKPYDPLENALKPGDLTHCEWLDGNRIVLDQIKNRT